MVAVTEPHRVQQPDLGAKCSQEPGNYTFLLPQGGPKGTGIRHLSPAFVSEGSGLGRVKPGKENFLEAPVSTLHRFHWRVFAVTVSGVRGLSLWSLWTPSPLSAEITSHLLPRPPRLLLLVNPFGGRGLAWQWCKNHVLPMISEAGLSFNLIQTGNGGVGMEGEGLGLDS